MGNGTSTDPIVNSVNEDPSWVLWLTVLSNTERSRAIDPLTIPLLPPTLKPLVF